MPDSTFATEFSKSLIFSETSSRFSFSDYFAPTYGRTNDVCGTRPYLLCRGDVSVTAPFSCETAGLNAFCLLYTKKGAGKLLCDDMILPPPQTFGELLPGTLAFIDCRKKHRLVCLHNIWEYTICFVSTPVSAYYHQKLESLGGCIFRLEKDADSLSLWERFLKIQDDDEIHALMRSQSLLSLYTQLYLFYAVQREGSHHIPSYLTDMKKCFDTAYQEPYSLDDLSARYGVNKFTLGRQFAKYYDDTPLKYLNKVRIEKAKELLLHTNEKIGAIAQAVGIENTNHFIRLFKEKTGVSPSVYRRETPVL